jgi:glycosyltransferase involved in cell wall biosynthesis
LLVKQIVSFVSNTELGGIANQARGFAEHLFHRGVLTELVLLNDEHWDDDLMAWYQSRVPTRLIDQKVLQANGLNSLVRLYQTFRARPEPIFHFHSFSQEFINWQAVLASRLAGKATAVTLHHTVGWHRNDRFGLLAQRLAWNAAHLLIVTTNASKEFISEKVPASRIEVIPCGVCSTAPSLRRDQARKSYGLSDTDFVVVAAGRISRHKGFFELIDAAQSLRLANPRLKVLVAGSGTDFAELSRIAEGTKCIRLLGRVDNLSDVMIAGDVFAMPSAEEGFGLVYGEAALLGVPSIGGRLPQVAEVIRDGETGWLVTPRNAADLVTLLEYLIQHPAEVKEAGRRAESYCRRFGMSVVTDQLLDLFRSRFGKFIRPQV